MKPAGPRHGLARVLSKRGICSRTQAADWIRQGRVSVNGRTVRDPEFPVRPDQDRLSLDGRPLAAAERVHIVLNKPRGLVTTARDEQAATPSTAAWKAPDCPGWRRWGGWTRPAKACC